MDLIKDLIKFDHKCLLLYTIRLQIYRSFRIYEYICTCMHIKKNIDVFLLKNIFKYNSGRVSITLQKKKKNFSRRVSVTKKNRLLKHRVYFTDLAENHYTLLKN